jgi:hypothetical protein
LSSEGSLHLTGNARASNYKRSHGFSIFGIDIEPYAGSRGPSLANAVVGSEPRLFVDVTMLEEQQPIDALRSAFENVFPKAVLIRSTDLDALRVRVEAVVDTFKAAGEPPERVIRRVKEIAAESEGAGLAPASRLINRAVEWAIERYFDADVPHA